MKARRGRGSMMMRSLGFVALGLGAGRLLDRVWRGREPGLGQRDGGGPTLSASTTIERCAQEIYRFLRDVTNFPRFVSFLTDVTTLDEERSHWVAQFPERREMAWNATLIEDLPDQRLAFALDARLFDRLTLRLRAAPGGRGTEVHMVISARDGRFPRAMARWLRRIPERLLTSELHRLKQVIELGEVSYSDASLWASKHPARPERTSPIS